MNYILHDIKNEIVIEKIAHIHFFEFEKNFSAPMDKHPFNELVFLYNGKLKVTSDFYNGLLKKGELIIYSENINHKIEVVDQETTAIIIGFKGNIDITNIIGHRPIKIDDSDIKKLAEIVKEGRNYFKPPYDLATYDMKPKDNSLFGSIQVVKIFLEYLLINLSRSKIDYDNVPEEVKTSFDINGLKGYLDDNFLEKITINELAFLFHTNRQTICKEFKKTYNSTINEYIEKLKVEKAKELMKNNKYTVTQISDKMKFESVHYFSRFIKKNLGVSPKEYREKENGI